MSLYYTLYSDTLSSFTCCVANLTEWNVNFFVFRRRYFFRKTHLDIFSPLIHHQPSIQEVCKLMITNIPFSFFFRNQLVVDERYRAFKKLPTTDEGQWTMYDIHTIRFHGSKRVEIMIPRFVKFWFITKLSAHCGVCAEVILKISLLWYYWYTRCFETFNHSGPKIVWNRKFLK